MVERQQHPVRVISRTPYPFWQLRQPQTGPGAVVTQPLMAAMDDIAQKTDQPRGLPDNVRIARVLS
ncbi:hypothetical protein ACIBMX_48720 [Streptomyces phaeochromogenes]|uniref:hypothetical protein n=1 Tax=Streptomyces phaeochromogenes TaxID=1923 RepID=UPI0033BFCA9B